MLKLLTKIFYVIGLQLNNTFFVRIQPYLAWFIATSFVFFQFFLQTSTSVISDSLMRDFHLSTIELGNLSAAFYYSYVLLQIPVGVLYDRFRSKNILIIAAALLCIGCFLLGIATSYNLAIVARILMGIGSAFGFIGMLKVIINNFAVNRFAFMLGFSEAICMLVIAFSVILLAYFLKFYSWRVVMHISALIAGVLFLAIIFFMREKPVVTAEPTLTIREILTYSKTILVNRQIILCSIYAFFMFALVNAFTSLWGVTFLTNTYGFSRELASGMVSLIFMGIAVGGPLNGLLSKRINNHTKIMRCGAFFVLILLILLIGVPGLANWALFVILFLAGVFCSMYIQSLSVIKDSVTDNIQATALAIANTIIMAGAPLLQLFIGGLLSNHVFGFAHDTAMNYRLSLAVLPLGMLVSFIISLYIREPRKQATKHTIT